MLFILGGAFDGLEKIIEHRVGKKGMGFNADVQTKQEKNQENMLKHLVPEDLLKFGLIPEFIGRVPMIVTLDSLDRDALIRILTEPKNALIKQYKKLFDYDSIELEFTDDAIEAIADKAVALKTGARGLRSIMESIMNGYMFDLPSQKEKKKLIIDKENVK